jgi:hypothetical protein
VSGPPRITWAPVLAVLALIVALGWFGYQLGVWWVQHSISG